MTQRHALVWFLWAVVAACGGDSVDTSRAAPAGQPPGSRCPTNSLTQPCNCANGNPGRQTCVDAMWDACTCRAAASGSVVGPTGGSGSGSSSPTVRSSTADPAENRSQVRFDWQRTTPTGGSCEAGHYEGTFSGIYGPSIIVVADLKVIPVFPIDLPGSPGLAFDLTREGSGEIFTVSNGKMNGNALGAFPFTADIVGKLDCSTLKFDAKLVNGSYFIGPIEYHFEGPIVADYDKLTHTLTNGTWMVTEPEYPSAGGMGDWTVQWLHN